MELDLSAGPRVIDEVGPTVIALDSELARNPWLTGGKASALSKAAAARLARIAPGVVLTTVFAAAIADGVAARDHPAARRAFDLAGGDAHRLAVRSSSVVEDSAQASMAGQFLSVLDVTGIEAFFDAVQRVLDSGRDIGIDRPIAVLVQQMVEPVVSGVMFGVDPVSGRSDRVVVTAVAGTPSALVQGTVAGSHYTLRRDGKVISFVANDGPSLPARRLRQLCRLEDRTRRLFGTPQDIEWAIGPRETLWLLQSRPVTTPITGVPSGPVYGPGPVAETFPQALTELERDLWVAPLNAAVREVTLLTGATTRRRRVTPDPVVEIGGHVAIDLSLTGERRRPHTIWSRLDPLPLVRRVAAAWRVGRLKQALPTLCEAVLDRVDDDLLRVPQLSQLSDRQLGAILVRAQPALRSLHAHEMVIGMITPARSVPLTGAAVAMRVLREARAAGLTDDDVVEHDPVVLALAPPRIGPAPQLPRHLDVPATAVATHGGDPNGVLREALRLRVRWVHELTARAAWELGRRAAASGTLAEPAHVSHVRVEDLTAAAAGRASFLRDVVAAHRHTVTAPLPARFQISDSGHAIAVEEGGARRAGTGAGGGVGVGRVTHDDVDPPVGSVLVTVTLRPGIGPVLWRLNGIVAETGSVLSHLAILAREAGVPIVVGRAGATRDLLPGAVVSVDGSTGTVTIEHEGGET